MNNQEKKIMPTRSENGTIRFSDYSDFTPNQTPAEILALGVFGGSYFRPIKSAVTNQKHSDEHLELPSEWLKDLDIQSMVCNPTYRSRMNHFRVKCGSDLEAWESKNWIKKQDPYGWFQWYCRFYQGRRTDDDRRQIDRWKGLTGPKGRFRNRLIKMCDAKKKRFDDRSVSPAIRQTLLHWAYQLTEEDFNSYLDK